MGTDEAGADPGRQASKLSALADRYRPLALAVTVIAVVSAVLPGAAVVTRDAASSVPKLPFASQSAAVALADPGAAPAPSTAVLPDPGAATYSDRFYSSGTGGGYSAAVVTPSDSGYSSSAVSASSTDEDSPLSSAKRDEPLRPVVTAWATRTAGTPLANLGVPEKSLPVGNRGTLDKASYLRLTGDDFALVLKEVPAGGRGTISSGIVQACQITVEGWKEGEAKSFGEAPAYDAGSCVAGTRADNGEWRFDLSKFAAPTDARGFALVPSPSAPTDFQVAFAR